MYYTFPLQHSLQDILELGNSLLAFNQSCQVSNGQREGVLQKKGGSLDRGEKKELFDHILLAIMWLMKQERIITKKQPEGSGGVTRLRLALPGGRRESVALFIQQNV